MELRSLNGDPHLISDCPDEVQFFSFKFSWRSTCQLDDS
jgi:hypothetical protein